MLSKELLPPFEVGETMEEYANIEMEFEYAGVTHTIRRTQLGKPTYGLWCGSKYIRPLTGLETVLIQAAYRLGQLAL